MVSFRREEIYRRIQLNQLRIHLNHLTHAFCRKLIVMAFCIIALSQLMPTLAGLYALLPAVEDRGLSNGVIAIDAY
jgi:hypothetical protein